MKGEDKPLLKLMDGSENRFIIPVYQRNYDWGASQCKQLFSDLIDIVKFNRPSHFFGCIVRARSKGGRADEFLIIDGQQRMTTVCLIFLAIYWNLEHKNIVAEDSKLAEKIFKKFLVDEYEVKEKKVRLKLNKELNCASFGVYGLKEEVLEATIDQVKGRIPVYAGTGCISTRDTVYMSKRAEEMGADVLSIITPSFALASQKELYDHYVEVAKHVNIPIVLYNIPARTGNKLLPETVGKLARDVDVIMGAKDSSGDIENLKAYIRETRDIGKDFSVLAGNDGNILTCLKEGGAGGVAGRANLYPKTVASIYNYFVAGDLEKAQEAQDAIATLSRVFKFGNPNTIIKKAVNLLGYPVGDCRKPFNYLCDEGIEELKAVLKENEEKGLC